MKFLQLENYNHGLTGYSNSLMSYMLGVGLSYLTNRTYVFTHTTPPSVKPPCLTKWNRITERYSPTIDQLFEIRNVSTMNEKSFTHYKQMYNLKSTNFNGNDTPIYTSYFSTNKGNEEFANGRTLLTIENNDVDILRVDKTSLSHGSYFFHIEEDELRKEFFHSIMKIEAKKEYEEYASMIINSLGNQEYNCIHVRRGDFKNVQHHRTKDISGEDIRDAIVKVIPKDKLLIISTDESADSAYFLPLIKEYPHSVFLDDYIFRNEEYYKKFLDLPYHEHIVLGLITQIICAASDIFVGTISSTFTGIIHTLRYQRYKKFDTKFLYNFNESLLNTSLEYEESLPGKYAWNRIKDFYMNGSSSWMREWPDNYM